MPDPGDHFAAHFEEMDRPLFLSRASLRLRTEGLVTVDGLHRRERILEVARLFMRISPHRDSAPDGLTEIRALGNHHDIRGRAGLGHGELLAHTDGAQHKCPPRLMLVACARAAQTGGVPVLTDGSKVYSSLARDHPDALEALEADRAAFFGDGAGRFSAVFSPLGRRRVALALRQDEFARFSPSVQPFLPALRAAIKEHAVALPLRRGQAYLLDNHRWLHARSGYSGPRLMLRALGGPRPLLALDAGFAMDSVREADVDLSSC